MTAAVYQDELVQDSFINGLSSPIIRQRLLEEDMLTLSSAFDKASALELAQQNAEAYTSSDIPGAVAAVPTQSSEKVLTQPSEADSPPESTSAAAPGHSKGRHVRGPTKSRTFFVTKYTRAYFAQVKLETKCKKT